MLFDTAILTGMMAKYQIKPPVGIDPAVEAVQLAGSGWTLGQLIARFYTMATGYRMEMLGGAGEWGDYMSRVTAPTTDPKVWHDQGFMRAEPAGERTRAMPQQVGESAWMLPHAPYDLGIGATWEAVKYMPVERLEANIKKVAEGLREEHRIRFLQRLYDTTDEMLTDGNGTGFSRGIMGGTTANNYVPKPINGRTFDATHSHLHAVAGNDAAAVAALLDAFIPNLREHRITSRRERPIFVQHSDADRAKVTAVEGYAETQPEMVDVSRVQSAYATGVEGLPFVHGVIRRVGMTFAMAEFPGNPDGYIAALASFGVNSVDNPLRIYRPKIEPEPFVQNVGPGRAEDALATGMQLRDNWGVGWFHPERGCLGRLGDEDWADPAVEDIV